MPRRGPSPTPFGELFNTGETERRDERRDTGREDSERDFRRREQSRDDDRRDIEEVLRDNNVEVDDLVSLAVEVMVDQYRDGEAIGEKTLQKVFGKRLGTGLTRALNPVGSGAALLGRRRRVGGFGTKQFASLAQSGFRVSPKPKRKRSTKEKASDKKMSAAFKKANASCRKKNGQFKKGHDQASCARMAQRLKKKM